MNNIDVAWLKTNSLPFIIYPNINRARLNFVLRCQWDASACRLTKYTNQSDTQLESSRSKNKIFYCQKLHQFAIY